MSHTTHEKHATRTHLLSATSTLHTFAGSFPTTHSMSRFSRLSLTLRVSADSLAAYSRSRAARSEMKLDTSCVRCTCDESDSVIVLNWSCKGCQVVSAKFAARVARRYSQGSLRQRTRHRRPSQLNQVAPSRVCLLRVESQSLRNAGRTSMAEWHTQSNTRFQLAEAPHDIALRHVGVRVTSARPAQEGGWPQTPYDRYSISWKALFLPKGNFLAAQHLVGHV